MHRSRARFALPLFLAAGCATYPDRTHDAYFAFQGGHLKSAVDAYGDASVTGSDFLSGAESGTVALAAGDWSGAERGFARAVEVVEAMERRALVTVGDTAEHLAAWAVNDTVLEYYGEGFERVYLHAGLAMAYLALGRLEDVWVEARLANRLLEREEELYERSYQAGGLGHFLSALAYEIWGEPDEAYIDYRRMEEKGVGLELAGRALVRIATELGYEDELPRLLEAYGPDYPRPPDSATIVVLAGVGLGPVKAEARLDVPTPDGVFSWAVPDYVELPQPVQALELRVGSSSMRTAVLEDVSEVASANLGDRLAWMAAKSAARGALKLGLAGALADDAGAVVGSVYALVTERADLRAWQSLPDTWQAGRVFVPPGVHRLQLSAVGGFSLELGTFELVPGETMIVLARTVDTMLYAYPVGGLEVDSAAPGWPLEPGLEDDESEPIADTGLRTSVDE
jgi:hypothetical protein